MASSNIALSAGILAFTAGIIAAYMSVLLFKRNKLKPQKATLYVFFATFSWTIVFFLASQIYFFAGMNLALAYVLQVMMYGSIFSAVIFLYMFARKTFFREKTRFYVAYIILGIVLVVILAATESSYVEPFPDSIGGDFPAVILKTEQGLVLVAYVVPTLVGIAVSDFNVASRLEDKLFARGFQVIGFGLIIALITMGCDTVATLVISSAIGYALALYAQWILNVLAAVFLYVGWTMPGWFQRRYGTRSRDA
ncbi:MAG: hypothetical protein Q6365_023460 [Candidatus Sigynarchaeota archaeon]